MAHISTQIISAAMFFGCSTICWAAGKDDCRVIEDPVERLACYDSNALPIAQPKSKPATNNTEPVAPARLENETVTTEPAKSIRKSVPKVVRNALEVALPRKTEIRSSPETRAVEYTISKVLRKYGEKIEYHTTDGRKFRKIGGSSSNLAVGDTVVAKLGVFDAVFLNNQRGTRIKVKTLN